MVALEVGGRIVSRRDGEVHLAVDVEQDCLDDGLAAGEEQVLGVRPPGARLHDDAGVLADTDAVDDHVVGLRRDGGV